MIKIDVTKGIKVGGFDYSVDMGEQAHNALRGNGDNGQCDCFNHVIAIEYDMSPQLVSKTFIHEVIEAINQVYCGDTLEHEKIQQLSFGLHQVFESLGIQFGNSK